MDTQSKTWIEERAQLAEQLRGMVDKADAEKRSLTTEEDAQYATMFKRVTELGELLDKRVAHEALMAKLAETTEKRTAPPQPDGAKGAGRLGVRSTPAYGMAFDRYIRTGRMDPVLQSTDTMTEEERALSWGTDTQGGVLAPETFLTQLLAEVNNQLFLRRLATKYTLSVGDTLGVPTLAADPADADWTTELAIGSEDSTMAFGKREMRPHPVGKLLKVSKTLLNRASLPVESIVMERLAYKFGVTEEKAFMTGTGASQPLGLFIASDDGIGTAYDVTGTNTATTITADTLLDIVYGLPSQYWPNAQWLGHTDWALKVSKLKDSENRYMWSPSMQLGQPNMLLGFPVNLSAYAPNTFTANQYVAILGDYSRYWIVDSLAMTVQRLVELYAATNQVGFIGRLEVDGAPIWGNAFLISRLQSG